MHIFYFVQTICFAPMKSLLTGIFHQYFIQLITKGCLKPFADFPLLSMHSGRFCTVVQIPGFVQYYFPESRVFKSITEPKAY